MRTSRYQSTYKLVVSALCLALTQVLPQIFHSVGLGTVFLPMHIPVFLCGLIAGPFLGLLVGGIAPLLSFFLGGPPLQMAISMSAELLIYGLISGFLYQKKHCNIYISMIISMILGRIVYSIIRFFLIGFTIDAFKLVFSSTFIEGIPGILLQLLIVPPIVFAVKRGKKRL